MTSNTEPLATVIAAERLCMALLKAEVDLAGSLAALRVATDFAIAATPDKHGNGASIWRRFSDLADSVEADLKEEIANGRQER